jgi:hypothetical protein
MAYYSKVIVTYGQQSEEQIAELHAGLEEAAANGLLLDGGATGGTRLRDTPEFGKQTTIRNWVSLQAAQDWVTFVSTLSPDSAEAYEQ